jgi:hypothetical protein
MTRRLEVGDVDAPPIDILLEPAQKRRHHGAADYARVAPRLGGHVHALDGARRGVRDHTNRVHAFEPREKLLKIGV